MSTFLFRIGRWSFAHRRIVLAIWLLVAVVAIGAATASGGKTNDNFTIPGTESQRATNLLSERVPELSGGQTQLVFAAEGDGRIVDTRQRDAIETSIQNLKAVPQVAVATDPFHGGAVSPDGTIGLGSVQYSVQPGSVDASTLEDVKKAVEPAQAAGVHVAYSGSVFPGWNAAPSETPEIVGVIVALIILLITFGSLIAAGMPIITAILGILITIMSVTALAAVVDVATASTTVAIMLGLSCGIDYGLFVLYRHRNHVLRGMDPQDSAALSVGTAGGAVVFAALTVIIALCGLSVVGIPFLAVMGLSAAGAVLVAMLIALTLLPAMLGFAGPHIVRFPGRPRRLHARLERTAHTAATAPEEHRGARWGAFIVRHRVPVLILGVLLLGLLALPATHMRLGLPSGSSQPTSNTQRQAYDLITEGFGVGANGPLLIVADHVTDKSQTDHLVAALGTLPDVAAVQPLTMANDVSVIQVTPGSGPNDEATTSLVHRIRGDRAAIEGDTGAAILVGGNTASNIDVSAKLSSALPVFLIVVVGLAFLLLTFAFRTFLVPLKSVLGFLLSILAAFGAQVAVFQWGWGQHLFNIEPAETVSFLPIIMLAIIFGLSSDYEVFVVSRIKEDYTRTGEARAAVVRGMSHSARVVTAAALIMFSIFVAFMFTSDATIKAIGFSFAIGVLLDAFVVRLTLVPAVMAIAGGRIWSHPRWFRRLPDPDIEGKRLEHAHGS
ncbi:MULTISPECIES: MMPL family transporter [Streptomyces]|jgi:RND superfamily putative drug exporter|uniref:MMPL family transporter n=1 Tax=Streptomyces TaxID=1883 RepID=UPI00190374DC|nr:MULTISPECIES: MMPL family transporter [unclassified Streptomyces]MCU4746191.1 MMPL family transporter [Streptomyces sp. G-5]QQN76510.1 MMPL family transporter [Streptomyces sp. XC 2026]